MTRKFVGGLYHSVASITVNSQFGKDPPEAESLVPATADLKIYTLVVKDLFNPRYKNTEIDTI